MASSTTYCKPMSRRRCHKPLSSSSQAAIESEDSRIGHRRARRRAPATSGNLRWRYSIAVKRMIYLGPVVEVGDRHEIFLPAQAPLHGALFSGIPSRTRTFAAAHHPGRRHTRGRQGAERRSCHTLCPYRPRSARRSCRPSHRSAATAPCPRATSPTICT